MQLDAERVHGELTVSPQLQPQSPWIARITARIIRSQCFSTSPMENPVIEPYWPRIASARTADVASQPTFEHASCVDIERRVISRESEFWKNTVKPKRAGQVTVRDFRESDYRKARSLFINGRKLRRRALMIESILSELLLVKGEAYVGSTERPSFGCDYLLTNFRIIKWTSETHTITEIVPLFELRSSDRYLSGIPVDTAVAAREWDALDTLSRKLLKLTRAELRGDRYLQVRELVRVVPAIRKSRFRFGHETQSRLWGVCAGVSNTYCIPVLAVRLVVAALVPVFGVGILIYLGLAIAMRATSRRGADTRHIYEDADIAGCPIN